MLARRDPSRERGSFLLVVLALGAVLLMVAYTTLLVLRNSSKMAGMQRREYQDLNAAEAGIIRMQYRLNQAGGLCNGWFSKADSDNIVAALIPTLDSLPSSYGSTRAVRMNTFNILPGRPMRIRFSATGGRLLSGGGFDSSSTHVLRGTVRMATLADFAAFSELPLKIGAGSAWYGKVHGDSVHVGQGATFNQEVTYVRGLDYHDPPGTFNDPNSVTYKKGKRQLSDNPFTLNRIFISNSEAGRPACSGAPAKTYQDLAAGNVSGERKGFSYTGATTPVYISLDSIQPKTISGSPYVCWRVYKVDSLKSPTSYPPIAAGALLAWDSVLASNFNGVVYVQGNAWMGGTLRNYSLTIASTGNIYATHNVTCVGNDTLNQDLRVTLGLIANTDFRIWKRSPTSITVEAAIIARGGWYAADGDGTTHVGTYPSGSACVIALDTCWNLTLLGGYITHSGGSSGPWYAHGLLGHKSRAYTYDADNLYSPPPKFPVLWGQNGTVPLWQAVSMGEN